MLVNDVGQDRFEEINSGTSGANYDWTEYEGPESDPLYQGPLYRHGHGEHGVRRRRRSVLQPQDRPVPELVRRRLLFRGYLKRLDQTLDYAPVSGGFVRVLHFASGLTVPRGLQLNDGNLYYLSRGNDSVNVIR